jgi:hypothetical protein
MTTAVAPSLSISPRVQLTARQRACLEQIARRQTSPQRLVRRAKMLLALAAGATQCHVMRQLHLNRGTVKCGAGGGAPSPLSWSKWQPTGAVTTSSLR